MRKFAAGIIITLILVGAAVLTWYGLNDQAKGLVVGVLLGSVGLAAGVVLAFAAVGVFLLIQLRWSVRPPPVPPALHGPPPALFAPEAAPPHWRRKRDWEVLGADDVTEGAFRFR